MVISRQYTQSGRKLLLLSIVSELGVGQLEKWWVGLVGLGLRDIVDWPGHSLLKCSRLQGFGEIDKVG